MQSKIPFALTAMLALVCLFALPTMAQQATGQHFVITHITLTKGNAYECTIWLRKQPLPEGVAVVDRSADNTVLIRARSQQDLDQVVALVKTYETQQAAEKIPPDTKLFMMLLPLRYVDAKFLAKDLWPPLNTDATALSHACGGLSNLLPKDITDVSALAGDKLLITGKSPEALSALKEFMALLDKPVKHVSVKMSVVTLTPASAKLLDLASSPACLTTEQQAMITKMLQEKSATEIATGHALLANGDQGFVALNLSSLPGVAIRQLLIHADNSVTIALQPLVAPKGEKTTDNVIFNTTESPIVTTRTEDHGTIVLQIPSANKAIEGVDKTYLLISLENADNTP